MAFVNLSSARLIANSQSKVALKICKCQHHSSAAASLKLKEWKPKCSTYTLKVPFPLVLWLYFQMLFFGYIRFAWNWIFRTSLHNYIHAPLTLQHGKINFVKVHTYMPSLYYSTTYKDCKDTFRHGTTTVTEVKLHYFRGPGSTMAVAVKNFSSISEWIWQF